MQPAVLLSSRVRLLERPLFFARAHLYADGLVFTGWHIGGRFCRRLSLQDIDGVEVTAPSHLTLRLRDGRAVHAWLNDARSWHEAIEAHQACLQP